jgi:hypothetical protein
MFLMILLSNLSMHLCSGLSFLEMQYWIISSLIISTSSILNALQNCWQIWDLLLWTTIAMLMQRLKNHSNQ